ncbi:hypothetical protein CCR97_08080 [Rhodoplanes elegans]|uniref:Uncharacterized protein n=1 Tax=Rhodoplanes elegans TaxID=29408 RepID=A0A327KR64_9BRAD|nr:hypothetical protein [Rhodoplanes elegans]MBK5958077.1 hypothetical protein [Rhodoplanes elegans]MBK5958169.1 hypothetical protein [Rhodoplanes elegans]RAI40454.1 hypothetical protein CH338_06330 [Rhodoplanes elegans]
MTTDAAIDIDDHVVVAVLARFFLTMFGEDALLAADVLGGLGITNVDAFHTAAERFAAAPGGE